MAFMIGVDEATSNAYYDTRKSESIIGTDDIESIDAATDGQKLLAIMSPS